MTTKNIAMRAAVTLALFAAGFAFPLLFLLAGLMGWALVSDLRRPPEPEPDIPALRYLKVTAADVEWQRYFMARCESPAETAFLDAMIRAFTLLPEGGMLKGQGIELDMQVVKRPYRLDCLVHDWLIVEIDGATYHSSPEAMERDRIRDEHFLGLGFSVLRIPASVVFAQPQEAVRRVKDALAGGERPVKQCPRDYSLRGVAAGVAGVLSSVSSVLNDINSHVERRSEVDKAMSKSRSAFATERALIDASLELAQSRLDIEAFCAESDERRARYTENLARLQAAVAARRTELGRKAREPREPHGPVLTPSAPAPHANPDIHQAIQAAYAALIEERADYFLAARAKLARMQGRQPDAEAAFNDVGAASLWQALTTQRSPTA